MRYRDAGVDLEKADRLVDLLRERIGEEIGLFGGLFPLEPFLHGLGRPVLVASADGVGTKGLLALEHDRPEVAGWDAVAMNANDLLTLGATPLFFLDYFATGALDLKVAGRVIQGMLDACREAGCRLIGGETAELPDLFARRHFFDVAGFLVGIADERTTPDPETLRAGDLLVGLPSSGPHANGYSLIRAILKKKGIDPTTVELPGREGPRSLLDLLLAPTRIYVEEVLPLFRRGKVKAAAHITGGGIPGNLVRVLPPDLKAEVWTRRWEPPPLFRFLAEAGEIPEGEMYRVFNMGVGFVLVVAPSELQGVLSVLPEGKVIGRLLPGMRSVHLIPEPEEGPIPPEPTPPRRRIIVFGSGSGSNFEAIVRYIREKGLPVEICYVFSDNPKAYILERARRLGVPSKVLPYRDFPSREAFNRAVLQMLQESEPFDLLVLAGYMRILPPEIVRRYYGKIVNIHPALLPAFPGLHAIERAYRHGVKVTGVTVHFVDEGVDTGPILAQEPVRIEEGDTLAQLEEKIHRVEHTLYPRVIRRLLFDLDFQAQARALLERRQGGTTPPEAG